MKVLIGQRRAWRQLHLILSGRHGLISHYESKGNAHDVSVPGFCLSDSRHGCHPEHYSRNTKYFPDHGSPPPRIGYAAQIPLHSVTRETFWNWLTSAW